MKRLKNNTFARFGRKYFEEIKKLDNMCPVDATEAIGILDKISVPEDSRLGVELAGDAIGGECRFFLYPKDEDPYSKSTRLYKDKYIHM